MVTLSLGASNYYASPETKVENVSAKTNLQETSQTAAVKRSSYSDEISNKKNIEKLSEKLQATLMYTKDASQAVAEMMLSPRRVEYVA